jgi:anti-sigma factor RsiW
MTCQAFIEFLMHYLDGELEPEQRQAFEEHLRTCPPCVDYLETYRLTVRVSRVVAEVREEPCEQVPEPLVRAILAVWRGEEGNN